MKLRERLSAAPRVEAHDFPFFGAVHLRVISLARFGQIQAAQAAREAEGRAFENIADLLVACVCDADGNPEFTDADRDWLLGLDHDLVTPVFEAALKLNRMGGGAFEDARKKSDATRPSDTNGGSRSA